MASYHIGIFVTLKTAFPIRLCPKERDFTSSYVRRAGPHWHATGIKCDGIGKFRFHQAKHTVNLRFQFGAVCRLYCNVADFAALLRHVLGVP